jgi:hypothetical protein
MQVDKVIRCVEFLEADVSHHLIGLGPNPFTLVPFILDLLMKFLGYFHPVFDQLLYAVDVVVP